MKKRMSILTALVLSFAFWFGQFAQAATLTLDLDIPFSGSADPSGFAPWLTITFDDGGSFGTVNVTFENKLVPMSGEFISSIYLNLDPAFNVNNLTLTMYSGSFLDGSDASYSAGGFQADGDGLYDILFDYPPPGSNRFIGGETVTFLWTSTDAIVASSFNFLSDPAGGHGPFLAAAQVQGIDPNCSVWIADGTGGGSLGSCVSVPEPATSFLLLSGLLMGGLAMGKRVRGEKRRSARL